MTAHDLVGGDKHFKWVGRKEICQCWGACCFDTRTLDCVCEDGCECETAKSPVIPVEPSPISFSTPIETKSENAPPKSGERCCENCGDPVVRNGTRGRYPKLCPKCKMTK